MAGRIRPDKSGNCELCGIWRRVLQRDRRIPGYLGGKYEPTNIQWICANCHQDKTALEVSAAHKGKPKSAEHRAKIGAAHMGHAVSEETRAKLRAANLAAWQDESKRRRMVEGMRNRSSQ